jgi:hypothetical protein
MMTRPTAIPTTTDSDEWAPKLHTPITDRASPFKAS